MAVPGIEALQIDVYPILGDTDVAALRTVETVFGLDRTT